MKQITVDVPETSIQLPDSLPPRTQSWTVQSLDWGETWPDCEPFASVELQCGEYEIQLDDLPADGWTITYFTGNEFSFLDDEAENEFQERFGEDAEFNNEHLRVLIDHLQAIGERGATQVWYGKQILLENIKAAEQ